jgi:hypothetical protein
MTEPYFPIALASGFTLVVSVAAWMFWANRKKLGWWDAALVCTGFSAAYLLIVSFIVQEIVIGWFMGGSPLNGKIEEGRFHLGEHERYTEVSEIRYWTTYYTWQALDVAVLLLVLATGVQYLMRVWRTTREQAP